MERFFKLKEHGTTVKTEIIAGLTTFFAMAYIIFVNPSYLSQAGMDYTSVLVATCVSAAIGCFLTAFLANVPFAQAPGMGLNAFFTFSVCFGMGYTWQQALTIVFISGILFLIIAVSPVRSKIISSIPAPLKAAISAGIGLFIAFLGFQNVGIIQTNQYTLVQFVDIHGALKAGAFFADVEGAKAFMPAILAFLGLLVIAILEKHNVKGGVLISIAGISVLYYLLSGTTPTFDMSQIGQTFKDFGSIGITGVFQADAWKRAFTGSELGGIFSAIMLIVTFCLVDMFDTIGTLYGTASQANMLDKNGDPINVNQCMTSDSVATVAGAVCGTSTCTTFVESAAGVGAGGRTGLTSLVVAICFAVCLFLSPVASLVPTCATAPALIYVGVLMMKGFAKVDMSDLRSAVPAFLALIMMPLTYSISNGIGIGAIAYVLITLFTGKYKKNDIGITIIAALFVIKFVFVTM